MEPRACKDLAGRCGMYCGACEIHRAYADGGKVRIDVAKKHNCLPADVRCKGCRAVHVIGWSRSEDWGRNCAILNCLKRRGIETCHDCTSILSCDRWLALHGECYAKGIDLKANLIAVSRQGPDAFVQEMDKRWRCQHCGKPIAASADDNRCHHCGQFNL
ncbi:MAG: DUF3795 domain-containing protein [bacterium]